MSLPGWEGRCWVTLHINLTFIFGHLHQEPIYLGQISTHLLASGGILIKTKIKSQTKLTVVMYCQIDDKKYTAPSSGRFRRQWRRRRQACGMSISQLQKRSPSLSCNLYFSHLKKSLILTIWKQFKQPVSMRQLHLKCLSLIQSCFQAFRCLVTKTKNEAQEKFTIKKCPQIWQDESLRPQKQPKIVDNSWFWYFL